MPMRRPNLLDALRRVPEASVPPTAGPGSAPARGTGEEAQTPAERAVQQPAATPRPVAPVVPRASSSKPGSAVPPAQAAPATSQLGTARVQPEIVAPRLAPPAAPPAAPPRERILLLALALAVATLALVLLLRRNGDAADPAVQAADAQAPIAQAPAPVATPAPTPAPTRAPYDAALYDATNRYTVRLIQYPNDKQGLALATEAYRWFIKAGFPVGSPILLANGRGIVLCASAKPTREELVPLRDNVRRQRYPESSKTMPFSTAYIDEIDDVLAR